MGVNAELRMPNDRVYLGYPYSYQAGNTPAQISWGPER